MSRVLVAYGPADRNPHGNTYSSQHRTARAWAVDNDSSVLVWRREGRSTLGKGIESRTRLHQALFCVRANFADDLWMSGWPDSWDAWDEAFLQAVLGLRQGRLIINGDRRRPEPGDAIAATARSWIELLEEIDPRQETPAAHGEAPDIGAYHGVDEAARLARKLRDDFELGEAEIAEWLRAYDYTSEQGTPYSSGGVHDLLRRYRPADIDVARTRMPSTDPAHSGPSKILNVTFGPMAQAILPAASAWHQDRSGPADHIIAMPSVGERTWEDGSATRMLITAAPLVDTVHLAAETDLAEDITRRMFLLALLKNRGVQVLINGTPLQGLDHPDVNARTAYLRAQAAVRLHTMLRAHDRGVVIDPTLGEEAARRLAQDIRKEASERSWRRAADRLNEEGIPTVSRKGQWWPSSVRELLQGEGL